ncbi:unnamed protein product [Brachionus calyciflorus]|uniref:Uncharacterized protein n=1 Tax=Brachionus calyciflorus TaxID=104777 RepID=A0A813NNP0_9BILA|nr:unnamed protein product [Brachionus calyciflorus]
MWNQNFIRNYSNEAYLSDSTRNNVTHTPNSSFYLCENDQANTQNEYESNIQSQYFGEINCKSQNDASLFLEYNDDIENNSTQVLANSYDRYSSSNKIDSSYASIDTNLVTSSENSSSETIGYLNSNDSSTYIPNKTNQNTPYLAWNNEIYLMSENNCYAYNNSIIQTPIYQSNYLNNKSNYSKKNVKSLIFGNYNCYDRCDDEKDLEGNLTWPNANSTPNCQFKNKARTKHQQG